MDDIVYAENHTIANSSLFLATVCEERKFDLKPCFSLFDLTVMVIL